MGSGMGGRMVWLRTVVGGALKGATRPPRARRIVDLRDGSHSWIRWSSVDWIRLLTHVPTLDARLYSGMAASCVLTYRRTGRTEASLVVPPRGRGRDAKRRVFRVPWLAVELLDTLSARKAWKD